MNEWMIIDEDDDDDDDGDDDDDAGFVLKFCKGGKLFAKIVDARCGAKMCTVINIFPISISTTTPTMSIIPTTTDTTTTTDHAELYCCVFCRTGCARVEQKVVLNILAKIVDARHHSDVRGVVIGIVIIECGIKCCGGAAMT